MKKQLIYIISLSLIFLFTGIQNNASEFVESKSNALAQSSADAPLCGVKSDVRYYFFDEGLYEFAVSETNTGMSKYSICIEGTEATGRCKEDNFNVPWKFYVDKGLSISVWKSMRRRIPDENGKLHSVYSTPEETTIMKDAGDKNWKNWKGSLLRWQEADSTGKVIFKISVKVKKIK